jgi:hypothetical protein
MATSSGSGVQPVVTNFTPEEIQSSEQDLSGVEIVYLLVDKNEIGHSNADMIDKICVGLQTVEVSVKRCRSAKQCFSYLRKKRDSKIYLVLLKAPSKWIMLALKHYPQIISVVQFDSSSPSITEENVQTGSQTSDPITTQLLAVRHQLRHSNIVLNIRSRVCAEFLSQDFMTDSSSFIRYQLHMEIIFHTSPTDESKEDFIKYCRQQYSGDPGREKDIDKFDSKFKAGGAVKWYTKPSFVYHILSRTFAQNDIRLIFKIRYFVCHLYRELKILHEKSFAQLDPRIHLYRGKRMPLDEFHTLKASIDKLVITKSFLSASLDRQVALSFSGEGTVPAGNVAVIFRMIVDKIANKSKPFAFVGHVSVIKDEAEVILPPGMTFKNRKITQLEVREIFKQVLIFTNFCRKTCLKLN